MLRIPCSGINSPPSIASLYTPGLITLSILYGPSQLDPSTPAFGSLIAGNTLLSTKSPT